MMTALIAIIGLGGIIIFANLVQAGQNRAHIGLRGIYLMLSLMMLLVGGLVLATGLNTTDEFSITNEAVTFAEVSQNDAILFFVIAVAFAIIGIGLTFSQSMRVMVQRYIVRSDGANKRQHPKSVVHTLALILMMLTSLYMIANFILAGGIDGIAEEIGTIRAGDLLSTFAMYICFAVLGVGLWIRRDSIRTLKRLGFRIPQQGQWAEWFLIGTKHLIIGAIIGFGMFWLQIGMSLIWQLLASPETVAAQSAASQALFDALSGSLWLGFLVAFTAGVGEELFFRGALQPIFGNIIVSVYFVMLHSQYILTPASLIIFIVSIMFGLVREHYTTPAAMMAHFVYNFTPFIIFTLLAQYGISI